MRRALLLAALLAGAALPGPQRAGAVHTSNLTLSIVLLDQSGSPISPLVVTAGQSFGARLEVRDGTGALDTTFCTSTSPCTLAFSVRAGTAPDGTAPTEPGTISGAVFSSGTYTTSLSAFRLVCANESPVSCLTETSLPAPAPSVAVTATDTSGESLSARTAAITVETADTTASRSFVLASPLSAGIVDGAGAPLTAGVPTEVSVWARILDQFGNAANGRVAAFSSDRPGDDILSAGPFTSDANGFTNRLVLRSEVADRPSRISATAEARPGGPTVIVTNTAVVRFFDRLPDLPFPPLLRVNNGTYLGVVDGDTTTKFDLAAVAIDTATNKPAVSVSGSALVSPDVCWTASATNGATGSFDPVPGVPGTPGCDATTRSGSVTAGDFAAAARRTAFRASRAGTLTVRATSGGTELAAYTFQIASYFEISSIASPSGRTHRTLVDWDATNLRIIAWELAP